MATSTPMKDLDEKFLQCPICMDQLNQPKILPCLHQFCEDCLKSILRGTETKLECPTCREEHILPPSGIGGFRTNYNTKNLIEFVEQQKSAAGTDFPVCPRHPEIPLELCCATCENQPICVTCSISEHKTHALESMTSIAKLGKNNLSEKLKRFMQYKKEFEKMEGEIGEVRKSLALAINEKKLSDREEFENRKNYLDRKLRETDDTLRQRKEEVEENPRLSMKRKGLKQLKLDREFGEARSSLQRELNELGSVFECLQISVQEEEERKTEQIRVMSDDFAEVKEKLQQIQDDALDILRSKRDWMIVQGISNICARMDKCLTMETLIEQKRYELKTLSVLTAPRLSVAVQDKHLRVDVVEKDAYDLEGVIHEGWFIDAITGGLDEGIVITGEASHWQTHITVIDSKGRKVRQKVLKAIPYTPRRYCEFLSGSEIATVSHHNEIGVYDIHDGQYVKKDINAVLASCPVDRCVSCLGVDRSSNEILVASMGSRKIEIFDSDLKHVKTLKLPKMITSPIDVTVHGADLIVLDNNKAFVVRMEASKYQLQYELTKPDHEVIKPVSGCTDRSGFVYVLWRIRDGEERSLIAEYREGDSQIIHTTRVHEDACSITTVASEEKEELFVSTRASGRLFTFQLVTSLSSSHL